MVLSLFAIGYATVAKHLTATGAFYGYIAHGLGRIVGMASGLLITMAYVVFEGSLIGIFSFFFQNLMSSLFGVHVHWVLPALLMLVLNSVLAFYDINIAAKVLGVFLLTEIFMLSLGALAVLFHGGGPDGFAVSETLNPLGAFQPAAGIVGASAGLGLFFAFWSWVGFESTAMYGEESRNPKKIIPRATILSVFGIGLFYVFVSWMAVAGTGPQHSIELAQDASTAGDIFFGRVRGYYGEWAVTMFSILLCTGSFAWRNGLPQLRFALPLCAWPRGPFAAAAEDARRDAPQARLAAYCVVGAERNHVGDPPGVPRRRHGSVRAPIHAAGHSGTMAILIVQSLCAFSVISYFHLRKNHPASKHWFRTLVAPLLGGIGMLYVVLLLWQHKEAAAGAAAGTLLFRLTAWIVLGLFVFGAALATYFKFRDPRRFELIGRVVYDETEVRD